MNHGTRQTGSTAGPDLEGLQHFLDTVDRQLTEFFVGREAEIDFIRRRVDMVERHHRARKRKPAAGSTVLITGVPGAGKTALMTYLQMQWDGTGDRPLGIELDLEDLQSPQSMAAAVTDTLRSPAAKLAARFLPALGLSVYGAGLNVEFRESSPGLSEIDKPLVIFVDEIQALPQDAEAPESRVLKQLHLGTRGSPVALVLAGLAHARQAVEHATMSRLSSGSVLPLGCLEPAEARLATEMFLDRFRVAGDRAPWPDRIARWSDGWPMHVHNSLRALAGELIKSDAKGNLDQTDPAKVRLHVARRRAGYYSQRTGGQFARHQELLGQVMRRIVSTGRTELEIVNLLTEFGDERPAGMSPDDAFKSLLSRGLLQRSAVEEDELYVCPIPSMLSFCAAGSGTLHRSVISGNAPFIRQRLDENADLDAQDSMGRTPLWLAASEDWPEIVEMLLEAGADPTVAADDGTTPAVVAQSGSETARMLIEAAV